MNITFTLCNKAVDITRFLPNPWKIFGMSRLRGHFENDSNCSFIYLSSQTELEKLNRLLNELPEENRGWGVAYRLTLRSSNRGWGTFDVVDVCAVPRLCAAK